MTKPIYIYHISRYYIRCIVFQGDAKTHERVDTSTLTPDKGLTRRKRYDIIAKWLDERFGLRIAEY